MKRFILFVTLMVALAMPGKLFALEISTSDIESAIMQEDYKKANDLAKVILQSKTGNATDALVEYYLGLSSLRLGEYRAAYDTFRKAADDAKAADLYEKSIVGVVDSLYMQGYYDKALKEATSLMSKHPHSEMMSLIYLKVARSNLKLTRWGKARDFLQKIISEYPDSFESRIARQLLEEKQYFTVQVGAFIEQARAEKLVKELIARQQYAYIIETKSPDGRKFFRVRVGQMTALKDAKSLETQLSGLGYPTLIYP
ncbi:MAG: SPOR domain-containing protein [Candidatus Omnitrophica bacterium]|nr:SPOR domain-containing protein [Candidatus Omnitrophota bacterium]